MSENRSLHSATANSENETFNRLRRVPIEQVDPVFREKFWDFYKDDVLFQEWLDTIGWKKDDLMREGRKYEERRRNIQDT